MYLTGLSPAWSSLGLNEIGSTLYACVKPVSVNGPTDMYFMSSGKKT